MRLVTLALTGRPASWKWPPGQLLPGQAPGAKWLRTVTARQTSVEVPLGKVHNFPSKLLRLTYAAPSITNNPDFSFYPKLICFASVGSDRIALWAHRLLDQEIELVPSACS